MRQRDAYFVKRSGGDAFRKRPRDAPENVVIMLVGRGKLNPFLR